jgi:hypothetical protein
MPISAAIKFTQGVTTAPAGQALFGVAGQAVVVSNGNDQAVKLWTFEVVDAPPGSTVPVGVAQELGVLRTFQFTPDLPGGYLIRLTVLDDAGDVATDVREFGVLRTSGRHIPSFKSTDAMLNYAGGKRGWSVFMEAWLTLLDSLNPGGGGVGNIPALINVTGAVPVEKGIMREERRLRFADIDPDVVPVSWEINSYTDSSPEPSGTTLTLVRRGATIDAAVATFTYVNPHAVPDAVNVVDVVVDGVMNIGSWSFDSNQEVGNAALAGAGVQITLPGVDANPDPSWTSTATPHVDIPGTSAMLARSIDLGSFQFVVVATSDVYLGTSSGDDPIGLNVWEGTSSPDGYLSSLTRTATISGTVGIPMGPDQYVFFLCPAQAQYVPSVSILTTDRANVNIARNFVTRSYRVLRSASKYPGGSSVHVVVTQG